MNAHRFVLLALLFGLGTLPATAQSAAAPKGKAVAEKTYYLVLLKNGTPRGQDIETVATIRAGHVAHLQQLTKEGRLTLAGRCPGAGSALGGMYILSAKDYEEARRLTEADPAVQAGSLTMEIYPWENQDLGRRP
jgi:uncharacterized protein YciI